MMMTKYAEALATLTSLRMAANLAYATYKANCSCGHATGDHAGHCPWFQAWQDAEAPVDEYNARIRATFSASDARALWITAEARAYDEYLTNDGGDPAVAAYLAS